MDQEKIDRLRGHSFYPSEEELAVIPPLYATERIALADKVVHLHYFTLSNFDWFLVELDRAAEMAFGWVCLGDPMSAELGYFSLRELRSTGMVKRGIALVVERDLAWEPVAFSSLGEANW